MKKILLCLPAVLILAAGFGCSEQRKWNREQRKEMREPLRDCRRPAFLDDLTDAKFILFSDNVATALEGDYPVYATFVTTPGVKDTVQLAIVETVVEKLQTDARNMCHIFPYERLVAKKILPVELDRNRLLVFDNYLSIHENYTFATLNQFVNSVMADTVDTSAMCRPEGQCASAPFGWEITEVEVVEMNRRRTQRHFTRERAASKAARSCVSCRHSMDSRNSRDTTTRMARRSMVNSSGVCPSSSPSSSTSISGDDSMRIVPPRSRRMWRIS